jgi:hypothetical protein
MLSVLLDAVPYSYYMVSSLAKADVMMTVNTIQGTISWSFSQTHVRHWFLAFPIQIQRTDLKIENCAKLQIPPSKTDDTAILSFLTMGTEIHQLPGKTVDLPYSIPCHHETLSSTLPNSMSQYR